jgi:hypothetical protein
MEKIENDSQKFLIYIKNKNIEFWRDNFQKTKKMGSFVNWALEKHGQEFVDEHLKELTEKIIGE